MEVKKISSLERAIESTLLRPDANEKEIEFLCKQALSYNFLGVCVNPTHVALAHSILTGSQTRLVTVVGFPLGANEAEIKQLEAQKAVGKGAQEIDMVLSIGALKDRKFHLIEKEISSIIKLGVTVKIIIETGILNFDEMRTAVQCAVSSGAHYIKTSTGYGPRGASVQDVEFLREIMPETMGIKASGGIKNLTQAMELLNAGAERLGTSTAETIIIEYLKSSLAN